VRLLVPVKVRLSLCVAASSGVAVWGRGVPDIVAVSDAPDVAVNVATVMGVSDTVAVADCERRGDHVF
jgi:hypothetical protein